MAEIKKIRLSGTTYDIVDSSALHTLDNAVTSGGTNAVNGSGIYNAITASSAAVLETVGGAGYQTASDVEAAISGKADSSAVTEEISAAVSGKADTSALTSYFGAVEYDSNTKHINFYNETTGGTVLAYVDAADFIKDGMVSNVEIKDVTISGESVTCLVVSFNTDAGKEDINIPIADIFDASNYYTKTETDNAISSATSTKQDTLTAGSGIDITNNTISVTGAPLTMDDNVTSGSSNPVKSSGIYDAITAATSTKQDTLVSGTNIKTIGNESVLGSGNISIMTASIGTGADAETLIFDFS